MKILTGILVELEKGGEVEARPNCPTNHYLAKVIVNVTVSGVVALAEIITPNANTLVVPAATDAAEGEVSVTSFDEEVAVGVTVSVSWPEFATVI